MSTYLDHVDQGAHLPYHPGAVHADRHQKAKVSLRVLAPPSQEAVMSKQHPARSTFKYIQIHSSLQLDPIWTLEFQHLSCEV